VAIGSITTTTGIVSWQPSGNPVYYIVEHRLANTSGNWASANVYNSAYTLTNLSPCKTYEVRLRTFCGGQNYSGYTTPVQFNTASTNPTVSLTVNSEALGCQEHIVATPGFASYTWAFNNETKTDTIRSLYSYKSQDYCLVTVTDVHGCQGSTSYTTPTFPGDCISSVTDSIYRSAILADTAAYKADITLLAKGITTMMKNDTVKQIVKQHALIGYSIVSHTLSFETLKNECTTQGMNIVSRIKTNLWNNGFSAADTARVRQIFTDRPISNVTPAASLMPVLDFPYLNSYYQDPNYPAWDSLSADYVMGHTIDTLGMNYRCFALNGQNQITTSWINRNSVYRKLPVWQVTFLTNKRNSVKTDDKVQRSGALCGCITIDGKVSCCTMGSNCGDNGIPADCDPCPETGNKLIDKSWMRL
jgi:phosphoribosyl-AMP cyclohydrolase